MTKFQKQMLTIAAAGALTAVTALPAMAFENEFHGLFNIIGQYGNMAATGANGTQFTTSTVPLTTVNDQTKFLSTNSKADGYIEQRVRLQYIAKASDDLKLVTHFEINSKWGRDTGADFDTDGNDTASLVVKHAYLDVNVAKNLNVKAGLQAYKDSIGGLFVDADLPAIFVTTKLGDINTAVGFSRYADRYAASTNTDQLGNQTANLAFADLSVNLNKSTKVGASYYLLSDETSAGIDGGNNGVNPNGFKKTVHTFAVNGATEIGAVKLKGFAAMQTGEGQTIATGSTVDYAGYAFNVQADTNIASGAAKVGYLYVSGDTNSSATKTTQWQPAGQTGSTFNDSGMMLMIRNSNYYPTSTAQALKGNTISNVQLAYAGYSQNLTDKLKASANVGFGWDVTDTGAAVGSKGDFIGTEVNGELAYKLFKELTVYAQAGYISLGSQYDAGNYKNPYAVRLGASFSF